MTLDALDAMNRRTWRQNRAAAQLRARARFWRDVAVCACGTIAGQLVVGSLAVVTWWWWS